MKKNEKARARDRAVRASDRAFENQMVATVAAKRRSTKRTAAVLNNSGK